MEQQRLLPLRDMMSLAPVIAPVGSGFGPDGQPGQNLIDVSRSHIDSHRQVEDRLRQFLSGRTSSRWLLMPGLRGTGKTTTLKQLYYNNQLRLMAKFYLSLDQVELLDPNYRMIDVIEALESLVHSRLEDYPDPIVLLFDEVQCLPDWARGIKAIFDRSRRVFIVATGSSAMRLQTDADVNRRSDLIGVHPLSLADCVNLNLTYRGQQPPSPAGLGAKIRKALFESASDDCVMRGLAPLKPLVDDYWRGLDRSRLLNHYQRYGNLPYVLNTDNELEQSQKIYRTLNTLLLKDIAADSRSSAQTLANMPKLMVLLAHAEKRGLANIAKILGISLATVQSMIHQLEQAEVLHPIRPWGAKSGHLTKPYRYLFGSPGLRLALIDSTGRLAIDSDLRDRVRGLLWEDAIGLHLRRLAQALGNPAIEYDTSPGGADFIVSWGGGEDSIVIEVGSRKTSSRQAAKTRRRTGGRYGLVVTSGDLRADRKTQSVYVPLDWFLLA